MASEHNKHINKKILYIVEAVLFVILSLIDRITKLYAHKSLKGKPYTSLFSGFLELHYLENDGSAFGLLKGQRIFFIFVAIIISITIFYIIIKLPNRRKYTIASVLLLFILTGTLGNMWDRILFSSVIDFIYISKIRFPIFNVADMYVSVSSFILILLLLFYYTEEDLFFLHIKIKKLRDI